MTRVKICGITSLELARIAVEAGADAIGLVIGVPDSARSIRFEEAETIFRAMPSQLMAVAVVQDPDPALADRWPGSWFQLHGDEDEALVGRFARTKHVIKGFRFDPQHVKRWNDCPHAEILLVDGSSGGRGEAFRHEELTRLMPQIAKPVVLAGGLTPQNVGSAIRAVRPFAVDVSSGVESSPGVKDPGLIREFCAAVAEADRR
ncbi:MAG: phosphoribosylanthranilate isomerase [Planctomycetota bacterium]